MHVTNFESTYYFEFIKSLLILILSIFYLLKYIVLRNVIILKILVSWNSYPTPYERQILNNEIHVFNFQSLTNILLDT